MDDSNTQHNFSIEFESTGDTEHPLKLVRVTNAADEDITNHFRAFCESKRLAMDSRDALNAASIAYGHVYPFA